MPTINLCTPYGSVLTCPVCQAASLHQDRVNVVSYPRYGAATGIHVSVHDREAQTTPRGSNPTKPPQSSVHILFGCAMCCARPALHLVHYQGQTFIDWSDAHGDTACGSRCQRYPRMAGSAVLIEKESA
jgi:hypothetical protein